MKFDLAALEPRHAHDLITGSLVPRPIAWVSSINEKGQTNIAPFSFFTGVSWSPPIIAFSVVNRSDGTLKDTVVNIQKVPEFAVNMVSVDLLSVMESTAKPIPYGEDSNVVQGVDLVPCSRIKAMRIDQSAITYECVLERIVTVSEGPDAANLILGRVKLVHIRDDLLINDREIDPKKLDALGRLSGKYYCTTRSVIESEKN